MSAIGRPRVGDVLRGVSPTSNGRRGAYRLWEQLAEQGRGLRRRIAPMIRDRARDRPRQRTRQMVRR